MLKAVISNGTLWKVVSFIVSAGLMVYVLSKINFADFLSLARSVPVGTLGLALVLYTVMQVVRALRFRFHPDCGHFTHSTMRQDSNAGC